MATQTQALTDTYINLTTTLSLTNSVNYVFQNVGNNPIIMHQAGSEPEDDVLGMVLQAGEKYVFENLTATPWYVRALLNKTTIAVQADVT